MNVAFTSIKVRAEDKRAFDRLLHELALRTGEDLAQHELFHRIVERALAAKEEIAGSVAARRSFASFQFDLGEETDAAAELDDVVYRG